MLGENGHVVFAALQQPAHDFGHATIAANTK